MHLQPGTFLQGGKYKIVRFIKSGGFGCTYEARHTVFGNRVAIKEFFPKDFCNRDSDTHHVTVGTENKKALVSKLKTKFVDEAVAIHNLSHVGIVKVSDVFEENCTAYYVMDYIDGCSLDDLVKRDGPLSEQNALVYIRQVCSALAYVHSRKRLHLDIKPGNIMIDGRGRVVLIDFGASKQYDEVNGENTSTLLGLTPGYAPAEQYNRGGVSQFTAAADIYSLAATLYKLLSGITPVDAPTRASGENLEPLPSTVSTSVRQAVLSAMALDKANRPQSVEDFLKLLDASVKTISDEETKVSYCIDSEEKTEVLVTTKSSSSSVKFEWFYKLFFPVYYWKSYTTKAKWIAAIVCMMFVASLCLGLKFFTISLVVTFIVLSAFGVFVFPFAVKGLFRRCEIPEKRYLMTVAGTFLSLGMSFGITVFFTNLVCVLYELLVRMRIFAKYKGDGAKLWLKIGVMLPAWCVGGCVLLLLILLFFGLDS